MSNVSREIDRLQPIHKRRLIIERHDHRVVGIVGGKLERITAADRDRTRDLHVLRIVDIDVPEPPIFTAKRRKDFCLLHGDHAGR